MLGPGFYRPAVAQASRASQEQVQRINGARPATQIITQASVGVGSFRMVEPLMFDVPFVSEPVFVQGAGVATHANPTVWHDPVGVAGIRGWDRNDRGHFLGAYCYFEVTIKPVDVNLVFDAYPAVSMVHHLMFFGASYKPMPEEVRNEMDSLVPRPVILGGFSSGLLGSSGSTGSISSASLSFLPQDPAPEPTPEPIPEPDPDPTPSQDPPPVATTESAFTLGTTKPSASTAGARYTPTRTELGTNGVFVPTSGTTYERVRFECKIAAAGRTNVTFRDCQIIGPNSRGGPGLYGGGSTGDNTLLSCESGSTSGILVEHTTIQPQLPSQYWHGPRGRGFTLNRCLVRHAVDGAGVNQSGQVNVNIWGCFFVDLGYFSPCGYQSDNRTHNDCIQIQGGSNISIRGNTLSANASSTVGNGSSPSAPAPNDYYPSVTGQGIAVTPNAGAVSSMVITQNWLTYGAQSVTMITGSKGLGGGIQVTDNRFDTRTNPAITRSGVRARRAILSVSGPSFSGNTDHDGTAAKVWAV